MEAMLEAALGAAALEAAVEPPAVAAAVEPAPAVMAAPAPVDVAAIAAAVVAAVVVAGAEPAVAAIIPEDTIGCKLDVWKGTAMRTKGGLRRQHLKLNRIGTVVSIKASDAAKRNRNLGNFQFPPKP
jgi:hypothetical protein